MMAASSMSKLDDAYFVYALKQAEQGSREGGIPIGSAIVWHDNISHGDLVHPKVLGEGRNLRVQQGSAILHAEIAALDNAGRLKAEVYKNSTMYTTLSPCSMCTGAILLYGIPRVVIGENKNFQGEEELLRSRGVEVVVLDNKRCQDLMKTFIEKYPEEWYEDIGRERRNT